MPVLNSPDSLGGGGYIITSRCLKIVSAVPVQDTNEPLYEVSVNLIAKKRTNDGPIFNTIAEFKSAQLVLKTIGNVTYTYKLSNQTSDVLTVGKFLVPVSIYNQSSQNRAKAFFSSDLFNNLLVSYCMEEM